MRNVRIRQPKVSPKNEERIRKNKKDEEEGRAFVFVVLFFGAAKEKTPAKVAVLKLQKEAWLIRLGAWTDRTIGLLLAVQSISQQRRSTRGFLFWRLKPFL